MAVTSRHTWVIDSFLAPDRCQNLLRSIEEFRNKNVLPEIFRPTKERALRYLVIHGGQVAESFPELAPLYSQIRLIAEQVSGLSLEFMEQKMVGININITPPGGEYRWHYDRNALTAILFLNAVKGGETEMYPGYRLHLQGRVHSRLQQGLDQVLMRPWLRRFLGKKTSVAPRGGTLLLMRGDRCLHSVRAVEGNEDRINIIFSFDRPGTRHPQEEGLNDYLYTDHSAASQDPNYIP